MATFAVTHEHRVGAVAANRIAVPTGVFAIAGAVFVTLVTLAGRYGWHRDELYFVEAGRHLAWGYVDQPPFTPLVARIADVVAPGSLLALRLLPALVAAGTIVAGALFVRELGGTRTAQVAGAGALAGSGFVLGSGHLLSTATFDLFAWMVLLLVTARLVRTGQPRGWLAFGGVVGAALLNKHLIAMLVVALLVGLVIDRRWDLLASPWLAAGGALALVFAAPNIVWQAANGWPQLEMARALSDRLATESRVTLLPLQVLFLGPLLVPVLWVGARWLYRNPAARVFRPLLIAWPVALGLTFVSGGRPYYPFPLTIAVALAGTVALFESANRDRIMPWLVAANAALVVPLALPLLPVDMAQPAIAVNDGLGETIGWPELVDQVAAVVNTLPAAERATVVLLTASYGEAGALDRYRAHHGLPPAHSAHNSYADFRQPTNDDAVIVAVRYRPEQLAGHFRSCDQADTVANSHGIQNEVQGAPIIICRDLRGTWDEVWPKLRHLS